MGCLKISYQSKITVIDEKQIFVDFGYEKNARTKSFCSNYYPGGMLMPNRHGGEYSFGFNGKEQDNEVKGKGNHSDFGARHYDSRLGRFFMIDRFSASFPEQSPYIFAGNNPIKYIDYNGDYKISKRLQKKYPQLTNMLKNIEGYTKSDAKTYNAFKNTLGLTDKQASKILKWGSGPKVKVKNLNRYGAYAATNPRTGNIAFNKDDVNELEGRKSSPFSGEAIAFKLFVTALHEAQHTAETYYDKTLLGPDENYSSINPYTEAGIAFEISAFGATFSEKITPSMFTFVKPIGEVLNKYKKDRPSLFPSQDQMPTFSTGNDVPKGQEANAPDILFNKSKKTELKDHLDVDPKKSTAP